VDYFSETARVDVVLWSSTFRVGLSSRQDRHMARDWQGDSKVVRRIR